MCKYSVQATGAKKRKEGGICCNGRHFTFSAGATVCLCTYTVYGPRLTYQITGFRPSRSCLKDLTQRSSQTKRQNLWAPNAPQPSSSPHFGDVIKV